MSIYSNFNKCLVEFANDLILICPEMNDLKIFRTAINAAITITPDMPEKIFYQTVVVPFETAIFQKNEDFLLSSNYDNQDLNVVDKVKSMWKTLDDENKECVWNYFKVLIIHSRRVRNVQPKST